MKALSYKAEARYARKGASDTYFVRVSAFSMLQNIYRTCLQKFMTLQREYFCRTFRLIFKTRKARFDPLSFYTDSH